MPAPLKLPASNGGSIIGSALVTPIDIAQAIALVVAPERQRWFSKLQDGLRKTGSSISTVFTGSRIDD
ncbi:MAG: signal recognition particle-docking protein FtsY, partial [Polaromonas sp.]